MPPVKASNATVPSTRSESSKEQEVGQAELQRDRREFRRALKASRRGVAAGLTKLLKKLA